MSHHEDHTQLAPPPHVQLIQMVSASWVSRALYAAARLGIADALADGAQSAAELATAIGAHPRALHRLMRTLASLGMLAEQSDQRFTLTPLGAALKKGAPGAARASVLTIGSDWFDGAFAGIEYSVRTGETAFEKAHGIHAFDYLARHPEAASLFNETMIGVHGDEPPAVADAYDFSDLKTIVDVGAGTGNLLATILEKYPQPRGVLYDLAHVADEAPALLSARAVADRVAIESGDFFERVPAGGDAYILSHIIHDWAEAQCLAILANCRRAMKPDGRLLIVEMVLPEGDTPHLGKLLDMVMLVLPGGEERTRSEYEPLLTKAGFRITRVVPTASAVSVVEAVKA